MKRTTLIFISTERYAMGAGSRILFGADHQKQKAFFSFHFEDIWRVNIVRNAWKIHHPSSQLMRSFVDSSLWENKKLEGDDSIKKLIRDGIEYTSAVCVLIGTQTWARRWIKYEIARAVIDKRGLLAVHINSIKHHINGTPDAHGFNPLELIGIYRAPNGQYYLCEFIWERVNANGQPDGQWELYQDYTQSISLPNYLPALGIGQCVALSKYTKEYCFMRDTGHSSIGCWINEAAQKAGR